MGLLCLGAATVAATWGGNGVVHRAAALSARGAHSAVHSDAVGPGPLAASPDTAPPPPDPPSTAPTAPPTSATTGRAPGAPPTPPRPGQSPPRLDPPPPLA